MHRTHICLQLTKIVIQYRNEILLVAFALWILAYLFRETVINVDDLLCLCHHLVVIQHHVDRLGIGACDGAVLVQHCLEIHAHAEKQNQQCNEDRQKYDYDEYSE